MRGELRPTKRRSARGSGGSGGRCQPRDRVGLFLNAWYERPVRDRVERRCGKKAFDGRLDRIAAFERMLADDGVVIVKFWLHIDARTQRARLKAFGRDPLRRWRATKQEWRSLRLHPRILVSAERAIRRTSTEQAPWHIVEGTAAEYRDLVVATGIRDAIHDGLKRAMQRSRSAASPRSGRHRAGDRPGRDDARPCRRRSQCAGLPRSHPDAREETVPGGARTPTRSSSSAPTQGPRPWDVDRGGVRRVGCGRQGWRDPTADRRARRARLPGHPGGRTQR